MGKKEVIDEYLSVIVVLRDRTETREGVVHHHQVGGGLVLVVLRDVVECHLPQE